MADDPNVDYANYGTFAWMYNSDPQVHALIDQASREDWPADKLANAIQGTAWWKGRQESERQWESQLAADPATAHGMVVKKSEEIIKQAQQMGVTIDQATADRFADQFYRYGWNDINLENSILAQFHYQRGTTTGAAATIEQQLRAAAADYLLPISDATMQEWIVSIEQGRNNLDTFKAYAAQTIAASNPWMRNQLDAGFTVRAIMEQPLQTAAAELGLNPNTLDLQDAKWRRLLEFTNDKGERVQPTEQDIKSLIRSDERYGWDKSSNANEVVSQGVNMWRRIMGKVA